MKKKSCELQKMPLFEILSMNQSVSITLQEELALRLRNKRTATNTKTQLEIVLTPFQNDRDFEVNFIACGFYVCYFFISYYSLIEHFLKLLVNVTPASSPINQKYVLLLVGVEGMGLHHKTSGTYKVTGFAGTTDT